MLNPRPQSTDVQIGDVLRFDGLSHRDQDWTEGRAETWLVVTGCTSKGLVSIRVARVGGLDIPPGGSGELIPISDLVEMLEGGVMHVVKEVGA